MKAYRNAGILQRQPQSSARLVIGGDMSSGRLAPTWSVWVVVGSPGTLAGLPAQRRDDLRPYECQGGNRKLLGMDEDRDLIPQEECWELLASTSVGRVALSIGALPAILPVQYHLDGRALAVCLGHRELPERALNTVIAFAADAIDPDTRSGWSVQVQGRSTVPHRPDTGNDCGWTTAGQVVQIDPATISGHRMHLCPVIDSLLARRHWH
jgi:Pyridoxamine 5'-phosphate oxidase